MEPSEHWSLRTDGKAAIVEFPHGTGISPAAAEALLDRWRSIVGDCGVDGMVIVVRTSRPCSDAGRRVLREAAQLAVARGVSRFAVVGERSKRRYLTRTVDVDGVDTEAFNDGATAVEWVTCGVDPSASADRN